MLDAFVTLLLSCLIIGSGILVMQHWRAIGESVTRFVRAEILFGWGGERWLVPLAITLMGLGVYGAAESICVLMAP